MLTIELIVSLAVDGPNIGIQDNIQDLHQLSQVIVHSPLFHILVKPKFSATSKNQICPEWY